MKIVNQGVIGDFKLWCQPKKGTGWIFLISNRYRTRMVVSTNAVVQSPKAIRRSMSQRSSDEINDVRILFV